MQAINRDRLNANSRVTLAAFVESAYLPWTKEELRASTSKGHHEIWRNYLREPAGDLRIREFRTVDANRLLRAIAKDRDLTRTTLQHIKSVMTPSSPTPKMRVCLIERTPSRGLWSPGTHENRAVRMPMIWGRSARF